MAEDKKRLKFPPSGIAFDVPIAIMLAHMGIVTIAQLKPWRGYLIVCAFVVSAVVAPPDVISQLALAIPVCVLYDVGISTTQLVIKHTKAPDSDIAARDKPAG